MARKQSDASPGATRPLIKLTHVGEQLISEMFNRSPGVRREFGQHLGRDVAARHALPEVPLRSVGKLGFDGASRVDVGLVAQDGTTVLACEAKLGTTGLSARRFEERFLQECGTSHGETRVRGSMPAILERKLPVRPRGTKLAATVGEQTCGVERPWVLVVRRPILERWRRKTPPALSSHCTVIAFEALAGAYGDRAAFNDLVEELLAGDYFSEWLSR